MAQTQPPYAQNGEQDTVVRDELDIQQLLVEQSRGNPLLERSNLGTGHYSERYLWQQVRSYRKGLFASIAFQQTITKRAIYETKLALGRDGYRHYHRTEEDVQHWAGIDEDDIDDRTSTWNAELERGEEIWESLDDAPYPMTDKQVAAVMKKTNVEPEGFLPIFWQMVSGRHDASKSKDAELLRDIFTDRRGTVGDPDEEDERKLFPRRRGQS